MSKQSIHALVTGASRGIGKSITEKLLAAGARVTGTSHRTGFPESFLSNSAFEGVQPDFAKEEALATALKPLFEQAGAPGVLINNAGISEDCGFEEDDENWLENWHSTLQVNLHAPALLTKWALNSWVQKGEKGILINIASRAAYRGDTQEYASYAASKGALVAFTKSIARGFGAHGIVAYSIAPGFTNTDMAAESVNVYGEEYLTQGMALAEITPPDEVGELAAFLASGKVRHMTGATFHINGGSYMI